MKANPDVKPRTLSLAQIREIINSKKDDETVNQFCQRYPLGLGQYYAMARIVAAGGKKAKQAKAKAKKGGRPKGSRNKPKAKTRTKAGLGTDVRSVLLLLREPTDFAGMREQRDFYKNQLLMQLDL